MSTMTDGLLVAVLLGLNAALVIRRLAEDGGGEAAVEVPARPGCTVDDALGAFLLRRILDDRWIHRRVESLSFVGGSRVRRRISLDLDVPNESFAIDAGGLTSKQRIVPLTFLSKGVGEEDAVLRGFDLRDEEGRCLAALGSEENRLAGLALLTTASERLAGPGRRLAPQEVDELWAIVSLPLPAANRRCGGLEKALENHSSRFPTIALALEADRALMTFLLRWLSEHFLLRSLRRISQSIGLDGSRLMVWRSPSRR